MEAVAAAPADWRRRSLPVLCGCALAGAAAVVALNDPSAPGSRFPPCIFHATTGLWCPGCGLTRGFHQLFQGDLGSALSYNVFVPLVLVAVVAAWWNWLREAWGHRTRRVRVPMNRWVTTGLPAVIVVYGVLRNIPWAPLQTLAP
ncbi:MAG: DUF2752 domain-containing protein [Ilumatobacteraceae bacterium]|jgi:hypothetical protein